MKLTLAEIKENTAEMKLIHQIINSNFISFRKEIGTLCVIN